MLNRTICSVFEEMRKCTETNNFSYLAGLIEEAQTMANRMEEGLHDKYDVKYARKEYKELREKIEKLEEKKRKLENDS